MFTTYRLPGNKRWVSNVEGSHPKTETWAHLFPWSPEDGLQDGVPNHTVGVVPGLVTGPGHRYVGFHIAPGTRGRDWL